MIILIILIVFVGLLIKHLFFWKPASISHFYKSKSPLFIAHRGLHKNEPENTTPAVKKAIKAGFLAVELDTFTSLDKKIICSHNIDLERETEGRGFIDEKKYSELKKITYRPKSNKNINKNLPLLSEVFDYFGKEVLFLKPGFYFLKPGFKKRFFRKTVFFWAQIGTKNGTKIVN